MRLAVFFVNIVARAGDWFITRFSEQLGGEEEGSVGEALALFAFAFFLLVAIVAALASFPGGGN